MADVFVSYARQDKARAAHFVELLEGYGWDVFWDQETRAGTIWPKVLEDELNLARCLLVLWTANSVASRWVRIEAYEALQNDKLLPVRLERVKPPMEFRQTQAFDLIGWTGARDDPRLTHLIADLCTLAKLEPRKDAVVQPVPIAVPTLRPAALAGEWQAPASLSGAPDFTSHRAPTYRSIGIAVPTLAAKTEAPREQSATSSEEEGLPSATPDSKPVTIPAAADRIERKARSAEATAEQVNPTPTRRKLVWGLGLAAASIAAVWIARTVLAPDGGASTGGASTGGFEPEIVTKIQSPDPPAAAAKPSPPSVTVVEPAPLDKPKVRVADPPRAASNSRCIEIAEKFQTTGQLTAEERKFLSSKECAK
jgi:hypothetical protein